MLDAPIDSYGRKGGMIALTDTEIMERAPSVFADSAHTSRSKRYTHISTVDLLKAMRKRDFQPFAVQQARARTEDKKGFTRHLIRFRKPDWSNKSKLKVGEAIPEVILINSHDGTTSYRLLGGMFRLVCTNGLIIADKTVGEIRIGHTGEAIKLVVEGSERLLSQIERTVKVQQKWLGLAMTEQQQLIFAKAAAKIRWKKIEHENAADIPPESLLTVRRDEDKRSDLWTVFNRVQENAVRGGLEGMTKEREGENGTIKARRVRSKEVKNINDNVKLNQALWGLAEQTATKLKEEA